MPQYLVEDPERFFSQISVAHDEASKDLFKEFYVKYDKDDNTVAGLRRRRRRASNVPDNPIKTVSLVEKDGVLFWRDGIPARPSSLRRRMSKRAGDELPPDTNLVLTKEFPKLQPNKVIAAIGAIDMHLNPAIDASLRSHLRPLQGGGGTYSLGNAIKGPFAGRTLLFVHGTFSNAGQMLAEFAATPKGSGFLDETMGGGRRYDQVVFFEHATLGVSPVLNALELGRAFAGSSGQIDVIAHSRGGLVVRWWLEAFGSSLSVDQTKPVRVVFAGSPLHGTSLAAPDKLQSAMSLVSNIGTFAEKTLKLAGLANPFIWVAGKLIEVVVSVTGALAHTPLIDGLVALIPGLCGQSMVDNNHEINLLRLGPCAVSPSYFVVKSNFEPQDPGWKFWQYFRQDQLADLAASAVFPKENDLVVDTISMTDLGDPSFMLKVMGEQDFGTSATVWHCNYFRQPETIDFIKAKFN